jgi:hypothetical protein
MFIQPIGAEVDVLPEGVVVGVVVHSGCLRGRCAETRDGVGRGYDTPISNFVSIDEVRFMFLIRVAAEGR